MRRLVFAFALTAIALQLPSSASPEPAALKGLPRLILWAWERPEDLRGLGADAGVAFLAQTITIEGDRLSVVTRRQPLRVSPSATLMAVTRIEVAPASELSLKPDQVEAVVFAIARSADLPRVRGVQIDFDAATSERAFYRDLLRHLREQISPEVPLSITALASWCEGDDWLHDLPIDEAVPMLFRMGPVDEPFRRLGRSGEWNAPGCRGALGLSLDEQFDVRAKGRRMYVFSPKPWTDDTVLEARQVIR